MDLVEIGAKISIFFIPFLFALCFHEYAHGIVAYWKGDNTAKMAGRLTMNPLAHIDWIGTVVLPLSVIIFGIPLFFGWAKPVPVNSRNLKHPIADMFWIALAGPMSNVLLAILSAALLGILFRFFGEASWLTSAVEIFKMFILTNLFLAVFNAIPLNPLDGGKIIARFLPREVNYKLEQNEHITSMILMALMITGSLKILSVPVYWLQHQMIQHITMSFL